MHASFACLLKFNLSLVSSVMKLIATVLLLFTPISSLLAQKTKGTALMSAELDEKNDLEFLIVDVLSRAFKCITLISDAVYYDVFQQKLFRKFGISRSYIVIFVEDSEDLLSPYEETQFALNVAKTEGCEFYVILMANGIQVARLLRFGDRYRLLNTRSNFLVLYDLRLFETNLHYLWKRIVNVVFIRQYAAKRLGKSRPGFELTTVPFPSPIKDILFLRTLDTWRPTTKFRNGVDLFRDKTSDLKNQTLSVAIFQHIPAVAKIVMPESKSVRTILPTGANDSMGFSGIEVEILETLTQAMNFRADLYEPPTVTVELWGQKQPDGQFSGLLGEIVKSHADLALADLHYTPFLLDIMDLSLPYNTECLTFLTPESLTNNSWKTLILPFTPWMWAAILSCLFLIGFIFYAISRFHDEINRIIFKDLKAQKMLMMKANASRYFSSKAAISQMSPNAKYMLMKCQYDAPKVEGEPEGLYLFGNLPNSILYTYGMLLVVSLPKLPTGWSLRMLTGWYWLYCTLVVVAYKASMTAILANPAPRVTIDTLQELLDSKLPCGGRGEINRAFFKTSKDPTSQLIGSKFELINDTDDAFNKIAMGTFAYYENVPFLKQASVKRKLGMNILSTESDRNESMSSEAEFRGLRQVQGTEGHNLHIMRDCAIHMPISIGLQKNSPIKPTVDRFIGRVIEAGLIKRWLDDVMLPTHNAEIHVGETGSVKALMNLQKFFGAIVALFIGYAISIIALAAELIYFNFVAKKHPQFDKYSRQIIYVAYTKKN